jgi:antitoxin component of MazEF toxin-antitoxin module
MIKELKPMTFRRHGRALALTIPAIYVHEVGLEPGDIALLKREPDGLRLRIVRYSTAIELTDAQDAENQPAKNGPVAQEATEAAE